MKDIYELLNDLEIDENEIFELESDDIEKKKIKDRLNKSIKRKFAYKRYVTVALITMVIGISSLFIVKPAFAYDIPIIGEMLREHINKNTNYLEYFNVIGKTKSAGGIDITFEQAALDDNMLLLSFIVKNNNKKFEEDNLDTFSDLLRIPTSLKINGKNMNVANRGSWEFIDDNTIRIIKEFEWGHKGIPNKSNIKIGIDDLLGEEADFGVEFFIDKKDISNKTVKKEISKRIDVGGEKFNIDKVIASPLTVSVKGSIKKDSSRWVDYIAIDDKGKSLKWRGGGDSGELWNKRRIFQSNLFIANKDMKSIEFIPFYNINRDIKNEVKLEGIKLDLNNKNPIDIKIDKNSGIRINKTILDGEYLILEYDDTYKNNAYHYIPTHNLYINADGKEINEVRENIDDNEKDTDYIDSLYKKYHISQSNIGIFKIGKAKEIEVGVYKNNNIKISEEDSFKVDLTK